MLSILILSAEPGASGHRDDETPVDSRDDENRVDESRRSLNKNKKT